LAPTGGNETLTPTIVDSNNTLAPTSGNDTGPVSSSTLEFLAQTLTDDGSISTQGTPQFEALAAHDGMVEAHGALKQLAVSLMKIANDIRMLSSGPRSGIGEILIPENEPGSSIMPGKVNPVIPEAVTMVAAQIMGNHTAITVSAQAGNFQLNVMLPLIADNLLSSLNLAKNAAEQLAVQAIDGFKVNRPRLEEALAINPILVTALNTVVGYEKGAAIAKEAYRSGRPVLDVALEMTDLDQATLVRYLDPVKLTFGGTPSI
jgi:fumarate hydratase class II